MSYNLINQKFNLITPHDFCLDLSNNSDQIFLSKTIYDFIQQLKKAIDNYPHEWEHIKKFVNPYEFINTRVPGEKNPICKYLPISRSFFKLIEILETFQIFDKLNKRTIKSLHLAEAPGGFIEAMIFFCKRKGIQLDRCIGMSLIDFKNNTPSWNRHFFENRSNICIDYGVDNCDMLNPKNLEYFLNKYPPEFDIITADGGFDFSSDFNKQENQCQTLIISEMLYAIALQKTGGTFILKLFDCYTKLTCEVIYILSTLYEKTYICKPNTSRCANSEKYLVCINYINTETNRLKFISFATELLTKSKYIYSMLSLELPLLFINKIEEINAVLGQQQLETISNTLTLITHKSQKEKLEIYKQNNIQKCINWCLKYRFSYNSF